MKQEIIMSELPQPTVLLWTFSSQIF